MGDHFEVPWRMFPVLTENESGMYGWPEGRLWFPLALTMVAAKPEREQR